MKKLLSIAICALMIVSLFSIAASANTLEKTYDQAKDGELLYEAVFNAKDGVYVPGIINIDTSKGVEDPKFEISDDGKTLMILQGGVTGRYFWGGKIADLTIGEGKSYTFTGKFKVTGTNAGVYVNYPTDGKTYSVMYGFYGGRTSGNKDMTIAKGGNKAMAEKGQGKYMPMDLQPLYDASEDGLATFTMILEGYTLSVYFGDTLFDVFKGTAADFAGAEELGLGFYLYNKGASITVKDVKIWKGNKLTAPSVPVETDAPVTDAPATEPAPTTGDNSIFVVIVAMVALFGTAVVAKGIFNR